MTATPAVRSHVRRNFSSHAQEYERYAVVQARVIARLVGLLREWAPFDGCALPLACARFSLVCSSSVYQWVPDLDKAFGEAYRVLLPGGVFAFALFGQETLFELKNAHHFALSQTGANRTSHFQTFPDLQTVRGAMEKMDFHALNVFEEREVEYHPDVTRLLRSLKGIGAQNASAHRPPGLASRRVMQCMTEHYTRQYGGPEGVPATYQVIYGVGVKGD